MTFDERLQELYQQGNHEQARTLAKAVLRNESNTRVEISSEIVRVETPHFRGTHRIAVNQSGVMGVEHHGTYQYKSQEIDLAFTTRTMNQAAYDQATGHLTEQAQTRDVEVETQTGAATETSTATTTDENSSGAVSDDTSPSPIDVLKELF
ncbi:hypothetical protein [Haladaptatus sp. DJG-WS-42]|uniref:hypothetical protein n=1 Tax=Haladaptatus sp. DJG-WS-42 TaxID=3120516 RepID=UPI0030D2B5FF